MSAATKLWLLCILFVAAATFLGNQRASVLKLRTEIAAARQEHASLLRTREYHREATPTSTKGPRSGELPNSQGPNEIDPPKQREAKAELTWRNVGNKTPSDALETTMWAASTGDVDTLSRLIVFEPEARKLAETLLERLPEKSRAEYPTEEKLIALIIAYDAPLGGVDVIRQTEVTNDSSTLHVRMSRREGTSKETDLSFVRGTNGWQFIVTPTLVGHFRHELTRPPTPNGSENPK